MKINIAAIRDNRGGSIPFNFSVDAADLNLGDEALEFVCPVEVSGTATNNGQAIVVQGKLRTSIQLKCSCCLEPFLLTLDEDFCEEFLEEVHQENQSVQDAFAPVYYQGNEILLDNLLLDHLILALPMRNVCREDCKGLCVKCGKNLNQINCGCEYDEVDLRLSVLKQFLEKK